MNSRPIALISGASSGLGAEFARQLAHQGYDLILLARRLEPLQTLSEEVKAHHPVEIELITADLSTEAGIQQAQDRIGELPGLGLLINNAGFGTQTHFLQLPPEINTEMVTLHLQATQRLTRAALPAMLANHRGSIINVSSIAAFFPFPGGVTYSATKAALVAFSEALSLELHGSGVRVQALCPGYTYTGFHSTAEYTNFERSSIPRLMWGPAEPVIRESLQRLERGPVVVIPGRVNKILSIFGRTALFRPIVNFVILRYFR